MNNIKRQKVLNNEKQSQQLEINFFDCLPEEILCEIAYFLDLNVDVNFSRKATLGTGLNFLERNHIQTRVAFLKTCKRFNTVGYKIFDNSVFGNFPLKYAHQEKYINVISKLLDDKGVISSVRLQVSIYSIISKGDKRLVKNLLDQPSIDSLEVINWAIYLATEKMNLAIVECVFKHKGVDLSKRQKKAVRTAVAHGNFSLVNDYLKNIFWNDRFTPGEGINKSFFRQYLLIMNFFLEDPCLETQK